MAKLIQNYWNTSLHGRLSSADETKEERETPASDTVKIYFNSIRKYPLLTSEEERHLAGKISRGDKEARRKMIEANLRLVVNIAKRYINRGFPLQDLIEEGNIGLIKAVERFKAAKGCKFSTYSTYWIKQAIERAIANQSNIVRLPIHITADISKITKASRLLMMQLNREPTVRELSDKTGLSGRYVKKLDRLGKKSYSLEANLPDGSEQTLLEKLEDDTYPTPMEFIDRARRLDKVVVWLKMLDDNERAIIKLRFGLENDERKTLESIGKSLGVTRERIRQIEVKALNKLKKIITESENIVSYDAV